MSHPSLFHRFPRRITVPYLTKPEGRFVSNRSAILMPNALQKQSTCRKHCKTKRKPHLGAELPSAGNLIFYHLEYRSIDTTMENLLLLIFQGCRVEMCIPTRHLKGLQDDPKTCCIFCPNSKSELFSKPKSVFHRV